MKKVYCKKCTHYGGSGYINVQTNKKGHPCKLEFIHHLIDGRIYKDCCDINTNNNCKYFKLKWYLKLFKKGDKK